MGARAPCTDLPTGFRRRSESRCWRWRACLNSAACRRVRIVPALAEPQANTLLRNRPSPGSCGPKGSSSAAPEHGPRLTERLNPIGPLPRISCSRWDITYLATPIKGAFFYLYLILEVYSPKIVGLEVFEAESAEHAPTGVRRAYLREGIAGQPLVLHSDNGAPMRAATMLATLQKLGVVPSFSRPLGRVTTTPTRRLCFEP
jgi:transposase InsO family protein